jgi:hypothetical protein
MQIPARQVDGGSCKMAQNRFYIYKIVAEKRQYFKLMDLFYDI